MSVESGSPSQDRDATATPGTPAEAASFKKARAASEGSLKRASRRSPWTAWAGKSLLVATSRVPLRWLHALAGGVARLGRHLPLREVAVTRINVDLCFPDWSPQARERLVSQSFEQIACMGAELGHMWFRPVDEVLARVVEVRGEEHVERARARGRGVIFAAPHLGAWELAGLCAGKRFPITTLYRAPRVREMDSVYTNARGRSGARLVPATASGVRAVYEALARGEAVALLPDQDPGRGAGVFVPFFGVSANTSTLLPRIAARSKATVLITFAERLPRAAGYRIHVLPGSEEISGDDLERGARAMNQDIERCVRLAPEQYLWSYKRFKVRPPGGENLYRE